MFPTALEKCKPHGGFDSHVEFDTGKALPIWTAEKFINTSAVIDECGQIRTVLGPVGNWRFLLVFAIMTFTGKLIIVAKSMNTCVVSTIDDECRFYSSVLSSSFLHVT